MKGLLIILNIFFAYFTDKAGSNTIALSPEAIARRNEFGIGIDSLDYAVSPLYIDSLKQLGIEIIHTSRWINGATIRMDNSMIEQVKALSFIDSLDLTKKEQIAYYSKPQKKLPQIRNDYSRTANQISMIGLDKMQANGFDGKGIKIAIIDDGFLNVDINPAFDESRNQILDTFNLVPSVGGIYEDGSHGACCLSIIAGKLTDEFIGSATGAYYYLIRAEDDYSETKSEADNQERAFEIADSLGVDIISSSLGYSDFDEEQNNSFTYKDFDGQTARNSIAATIAARKGIIVCIAAGNTGTDRGNPYITPPADADSILAVGAVRTDLSRASFSSIGPTNDGRIKPDIAALGSSTTTVNVDGSIHIGDGTSFATPLIAGLAATLWQALPDLTNMEIIERIKNFASQHDNPDNYLGYGIANAWFSYNEQIFSNIHKIEAKSTVNKIFENGQIIILKDNIRYDIVGRPISNNITK